MGALRGARPAAFALTAVGIAGLTLVVITDVPNLHRVGLIGKLYEDPAAGPRIGFYLETAGCVLLIAAGGLLLVLGAPERRSERVYQR